MAARARNAARRGGLIAGVGLLAVATTLLLLVLVPREVNRTVRARIAALPPIVDTLPLLANLTGATDRVRNAEATLQFLLQSDADRVASATANVSTDRATATPAPNAAAEQTDARKELTNRVARAHTAPLVENFRAVGEAELLRNDARARVLLDSLNDVNRNREAYAALGGPDARYAAMTAKLATLGQRLLMIGDQRLLATSTSGTSLNPSASPPHTNASTVPTTATAPTVADSLQRVASNAAQPTVDTAMLAPAQRFGGDSSAQHLARQGLDTAKMILQAAEKTLADVRASNIRIAEERRRAEADSPARVPPVAMLFAALVTGLAVGFGVAFFIEIKRPRVADVAEVERVTDARVILHTGARLERGMTRTRRQGDDGIPPIIDSASEAYQLLHVTLTGYGDTSRDVQVISSDALLGATIGINLAAAAVRDSRDTLLVDASTPPRLVSRLLKNTKVRSGPASASSLQAQIFTTKLGRDLALDTISLPGETSDAVNAELQEIANEHDFTVVVRSDTLYETQMPLSATDVILCARVGVTRLDWLISRTATLRAQQHRVRAVLLWATRAPSFR
ncbi:MAG: hypothetical protein ABJB74_08195 [Gemmatimonas sp.]